jgi:hypothetical protein
MASFLNSVLQADAQAGRQVNAQGRPQAKSVLKTKERAREGQQMIR